MNAIQAEHIKVLVQCVVDAAIENADAIRLRCDNVDETEFELNLAWNDLNTALEVAQWSS